jgi:hypothetical protein
MDTGQGIPADAPATWRSALFLPDRLATWAAGSRVAGPDGPRPLVASTDSIGWADSPTLPTGGLDWPALVMTALLVLVVGWTALDLRTGGTRRGAAWLDVPLLSALGFAGLLIGFLWFVALHAVTKNNLNLLWALPTNLVLVAVYGRQRGRPWKIALLAATAVCAFVFAVGWPVWPQELPLATLPLAVAVAVRMSGLVLLERRARAREGTARS